MINKDLKVAVLGAGAMGCLFGGLLAEKGLNVMDMTAFTLCQENNLPIIVFDMNTRGNFKKLADGEVIGTLVHA